MTGPDRERYASTESTTSQVPPKSSSSARSGGVHLPGHHYHRHNKSNEDPRTLRPSVSREDTLATSYPRERGPSVPMNIQRSRRIARPRAPSAARPRVPGPAMPTARPRLVIMANGVCSVACGGTKTRTMGPSCATCPRRPGLCSPRDRGRTFRGRTCLRRLSQAPTGPARRI